MELRSLLRRSAVLAAVSAALLFARPATAHWCDDLWGSAYNLVVRPASDTVAVPASGSALLDVYVQNNMGYPLVNFDLTASATNYGITLSSNQAPKVSGYLMPGEKLKYTFAITGSPSTLGVQSINFFVGFGDLAGQDGAYGTATGGKDVVIKKVDTTIVPPAPLPALGQGNSQALNLRYSAQADYGGGTTGIDNLLAKYCAGRATWDHNSDLISTTACGGASCCPNATTTTCPAAYTSNPSSGTKFDWDKLWIAAELAARKSGLGTRISVARDRFKCGWVDTNPTFRVLPMFALGYLGEDSGARSFIVPIMSSANAVDAAAAKAALLLFKNPSDATTYPNLHSDVVAGMANSNEHISDVSAAAIAIVDRNDTAVTQYLLPRARWTYPDDSNAMAFLAAHLMELAAWDRRGWAVNAGDTGCVSFYTGCGAPDTTPPKAPAGVNCTTSGLPEGTLRVSWQAVTQDVNNGAETMGSYRVYWGNAGPRPGSCLRPGDASCTYGHVDPLPGTFRDYPSSDGTQTFYYGIEAIDAAGNTSVFSSEATCKPRYSPVARTVCTPTSGDAPLTVTCSGTTSSDANGNADITGWSFRLDAQAPVTGQPQVTFNALAAGSHVVALTVTDSTGLTSTASASIVVTTPPANRPPVAQASATPTSGPAPLAVTFSSAGSSDPDPSQTISFNWNFGDGSAPDTRANPTHTYATAGAYTVMLAVTDNGAPPLTSYAQLTVTATTNRPPDLTAASARPLRGQVPLTVTFDGTGVTDPDGNQVTLIWTFGDGTSPVTNTPAAAPFVHTYAAAATYTARASATDNGLPALPPVTKDFTVEVSLTPPQNRAPDCSTATVTPLSGPPPLTVNLDASGCTDPDGDSLSFQWFVPDASGGTDVVPSATGQATLQQEGQIAVRLVVTDAAASPMQTNRRFTVNVSRLGPGEGGLVGECGCVSAATLPAALLGLAVSTAVLRRRRRPTH